MDKKQLLIKNTGILFIGNFASKILSFILVPLYTHYLTPEDYGQVDLYLTILSMLYIVVSLQSIESVFRFIQDCKDDTEKTNTVTNSLFISFLGIFVYIILMIILGIISKFKYTFIFIFYVIFSIISSFLLQLIRGLNRTTSYMIIGIFSTIISACCNILFVVGVGLGSLSLILTPILTNIFVILYILIRENVIKYIDFRCLNKVTLKEQLKFSLPLLPNAICLWLLSSIGRFVLLFYYGSNEVGLLAATLKFPLLFGTITSIFHMSWQVSIISEFNSEDRDLFASDTFNNFARIILSSIFIALPTIKILIFLLMGEGYQNIWIYIPIFLLGVIFQSFAEIFNIGFYGGKKTGNIFYSSLISASIYLILALLFCPKLYIFGIGLAFSISELIRWIYINQKVSKYMKISIYFDKYILISLCLLIFTTIYYLGDTYVQIFMLPLSIFIFILFNRKLVDNVFQSIKKMSKGIST